MLHNKRKNPKNLLGLIRLLRLFRFLQKKLKPLLFGLIFQPMGRRAKLKPKVFYQSRAAFSLKHFVF